MHKDLNSVKGGTTAMTATWFKLGLNPPLTLQNKFENKSPLNSGDERTSRGATKLTSLAGAVLNHKDDKKGHHKVVNNFFEVSRISDLFSRIYPDLNLQRVLGYTQSSPDTSNTRYGSHCDAATELLVHLDTYLELFEILRDGKGTRTCTIIENKACLGLKDEATITELVVCLCMHGQ
jgi:hypothetical protein